MAVRAGTLRYRIVIEQKGSPASQDGLGEPVVTWSTFATVWADYEPISGREYFASGGRQGEATGRFVIRDLAGIQVTMRVVWRGQYYDIKENLPPRRPGERRSLMVTQVL